MQGFVIHLRGPAKLLIPCIDHHQGEHALWKQHFQHAHVVGREAYP